MSLSSHPRGHQLGSLQGRREVRSESERGEGVYDLMAIHMVKIGIFLLIFLIGEVPPFLYLFIYIREKIRLFLLDAP